VNPDMQRQPQQLSADAVWAAARAAYQAGNADAAEALCRQLLKLAPRHVDALLMQGVIAGWRGNRTLGIKTLRQAISLRPQSLDAHIHLGNFLADDGKLPQAISVLQRAVQIGAGSAAAHCGLGAAYLNGNRFADAVDSLTRAIQLDPDMTVAYFHLAVALEQQNRDAEAAAAYRRVIALDPGQGAAHANLGNILYANGQHDDAMACFRRAADAMPDTTMGRLNRAKVLLEESHAAAAEACLREAVARDPGSSDAQRLLGRSLKEAGRFDEAIACFERVIASDSGRLRILGYYELAHAKKLTEADRPLIRRMQALANGADFAADDRAYLHFALGKAFDDLGAYADAIRHYDEANRLKRAGRTFDRERLVRAIDTTIATYSADFFARNRDAGSDSERPIFILGMMRSGTTLIEQIISSHPDVQAGGELLFWGDRAAAMPEDAYGEGRAEWGRLAEDYLSLLRTLSPDARRVTDKMPDNFRWIGLIHSAFPQARIIHSRRNAIDTCLSIYFTLFSHHKYFAYDRDDIAFYYEQYARLMAHWRAVLPPDRLLEIDYETLVADRRQVTERLLAFCGLDWDERCLQPESNRRTVKTASMWQARQPIYGSSVERWRRYEPWLGEFRRLLPEA